MGFRVWTPSQKFHCLGPGVSAQGRLLPPLRPSGGYSPTPRIPPTPRWAQCPEGAAWGEKVQAGGRLGPGSASPAVLLAGAGVGADTLRPSWP
jgi:hypothetical protein